jgi:hypothetical protein
MLFVCVNSNLVIVLQVYLSRYSDILPNCRKPTLWSAKHDKLLCREILVVNPFTGTKQRTVQQGAKVVWGIIAENLNKIQDIYFKVSQRSVRDHYNLLAKQL